MMTSHANEPEVIPVTPSNLPSTPLVSLTPLTIEKLIYGGDGLARAASGEVLFVPWTAPGDEILASVQPVSLPDRVQVVDAASDCEPSSKAKPKHRKPPIVRLERLVKPSIDRVEPRCDGFGVCGGCQWQHINDAAQRDWKRHIVEESLQRLGGFKLVQSHNDATTDEPNTISVNPTWGSDALSWRYRNRVQWDFAPLKGQAAAVPSNGQGAAAPSNGLMLGYSQAKSNALVSFTDCHLVSDDMNRLYHAIQTELRSDAFAPFPQVLQALQRVELACNPVGDCLLSIESTCPSNALEPWRDLTQRLITKHAFLKGVVHVERVLDRRAGRPSMTVLQGEGALTHRLLGHQYRVSAGSFFQTNFQATEKIIQHVLDWLPNNTANLIDLYAGVGTFAIALRGKAKHILAVESGGQSIQDARENVRLNQADNVTIQVGLVERVLEGFKKTFEAAILDPPRSGATPAVLDWLAASVTERILYISCNPTTLARDLKRLTASGWRVASVQPVDMFPQTYHVETMVQLLKDKTPETFFK
jgi:23S rRNA (uracil1939-C5)-methyltransferase